MTALLDTPLVAEVEVDEAAARRSLRAQIARLERSGKRAPGGTRGPRLLSLGELEAVRDALASSSGHFDTHTVVNCPLDEAWRRLERMLADPAAHRRERVALAELGRPGCGVYRVKPRLGVIGMLAGWWEVVVSSGCPLAVAVAAAFALAVAPAQAAQPTVMSTQSCDEHEAVVDGDPAAVAARLPAGFTPVTDLDGSPLIVAHAIRCDRVELGEHAGPATFANIGILVQSPDGVGCASGAPVIGQIKGDIPPACNWYSLAWWSDDRCVARWTAGALSPITFSLAGSTLHAEVPGTFAIDDTYRMRPGTISVRGAYWTTTQRLGIASDTITSGDATGTLTAESPEIRALLGAAQRPFVPGYDAVAAVHWDALTYAKQSR